MDRFDFLGKMYEEMWDNINRHILVVWQSVGVLVGTIGSLILAEKKILSLDFATALIVIVACWQVAHIIDANAWFNRNLWIVRNIERTFLKSEDRTNILFYFAEARTPRWLTHLVVQMLLGVAVALLALSWHFYNRLYAVVFCRCAPFEMAQTIPYITAFGACIILWRFNKSESSKYDALKSRSPGPPLADDNGGNENVAPSKRGGVINEL